jgi:magnesium transporter
MEVDMESARKTPIDLSAPAKDYIQQHVAVLYADQSAGEAIESIREQDIREAIIYFYVVDIDNKLVGVVPVRRLLMSPPGHKIGEIMDRNVVSIDETASLFEASEILLERRFMAIPVVNGQAEFQGIIDITLFSAETTNIAHKTEIDNVFQIIGVHLRLGRKISPWTNFRIRFPWLLCNIAGGLICALIASHYESLIGMATFLVFFIPVVLTTAESVGMQSMTLALQSFSHSRKPIKLMWRFVRRELIPAILLGVCCGAIIGMIAFVWKGQIAIALALGLAIASSIVIACLLGVIIPGLVRALHIDPKVSSGPVVLAVADVCTLVLLFNIALWLVG